MAALILGKARPSEDANPDAALNQAMEDLHRSLTAESPSYKGMASAFRAAFDILDCEPDKDDDTDGGGE